MKNIISILSLGLSSADGKPSDPLPKKEEEKTGDSHLLGDRRKIDEVENGTPLSVDVPEEEQDVVLQALKDEGALGPDEILEFTGIEASNLPAILIKMELMGKIKKENGGKYSTTGDSHLFGDRREGKRRK